MSAESALSMTSETEASSTAAESEKNASPSKKAKTFVMAEVPNVVHLSMGVARHNERQNIRRRSGREPSFLPPNPQGRRMECWDAMMHTREVAPLPEEELQSDETTDMLVDGNGTQVAMTITQEKGELKAALVPIASHIVEGAEGMESGNKRGREEGHEGGVSEAFDVSSLEAQKSRVQKWEQLEPHLYLCKDWVDLYTKQDIYNIGCNTIDSVIKRVKQSVCGGYTAPRLGVTCILHFIDGKLADHQVEMERRNETERFDDELLVKIMEAMCTFKASVYGLGYYNWVEEVELTEKQVDDMKRTLINYGSIDSITESSGSACQCDLCSKETEKSFATECGNAMRQAHYQEYNKWVKEHDIAMMMLPEPLREEALKYNMKNRKAITDGACTCYEAWENLEKLVGRLTPNDKASKIFRDKARGWTVDYEDCKRS